MIKGIIFSDEHKKNLSNAWTTKRIFEQSKKMKNRIISNITRRKISEATKGNKYALGYKHTEEAKRKMSKSTSGKNHPFYGNHRSEETVRKISETRKRLIKEGKIRMDGKYHPNYGKPRSEETKEKIRLANIGKKHSEETKRKIVESRKDYRHSEDTRRKISKARKGYKVTEEQKKQISKTLKKKYESGEILCPMLGRKHSEETKKKMSESKKGFHHTEESKMKMSISRKGKKRSEECKIVMSKSSKERFKDKTNHPSWQGGISFEPYGLEFNKQLKNQIRERDGFECQQCHQNQEQLGYKLPVHHIDYCKQNNSPSNLISLCKSCHAQTNYSREDWTKYFKRRCS